MMRRISAQYVLTMTGRPLRRGVVTVAGDGTVTGVEDTGGDLVESAGTEFYNGIIIPGLINCHSHLELSHMRGLIPSGGGLGEFVEAVRTRREASQDGVVAAAARADREMYREGITACGDISNNSLTAGIKHDSAISYVTFAEVFGTDPSVADARMSNAIKVVNELSASELPVQITPHSLYSVSPSLWRMIMEQISPASLISLHFLESDYERRMTSQHVNRVAELSRLAATVLLVHNTVITDDEARAVVSAGNTWFCLCPSSNMYISGMMPPAAMLREITDRITVGTDSLASTGSLSIISELRLLQDAAPLMPLEEIIRWGTLNGARALGMENTLGSIEPGKKPGLLLVDPVDLVNMRLLPGSRVRRLL
jgi:cytosine/adenosine deaminase-related metal-dependent hydrolase